MISEMMEDRVHETLHTNMSHLKHVDVLQLLYLAQFQHIFAHFFQFPSLYYYSNVCCVSGSFDFSVIFLTPCIFPLSLSQWKAPDLAKMFSWQRMKSVVSASNPGRSSSASQSCSNLRRPSRFVVRLTCVFFRPEGILQSGCIAFTNTL